MEKTKVRFSHAPPLPPPCSIKNEQSKLSEAVRDIKSKNRLLITGTPLQVGPGMPHAPCTVHRGRGPCLLC
jgi:hypothetical protein